MDAERERRSLRGARSRPRALDAWPPEGAEPLEVDYLYDLLAEAGLEYGPAFQGLSAAWREGERIYAEVSLPEEQRQEAGALRDPSRPARLGAARHRASPTRAGGDRAALVLERGLAAAEGARELRVRIVPQRGRVSLALADGAGAPAGHGRLMALARSIRRSCRVPSARQQRPAGPGVGRGPPRRAGAAPPEVELLRCEPDATRAVAEAARKAAQDALEAVQHGSPTSPRADSRLALVTEGAMAARRRSPPTPPRRRSGAWSARPSPSTPAASP